MRMQLVHIDALQHDVVITDRENDVAVILPDLNIVVPGLASIVELQFVHAQGEVGNRCIDPALPDDKSIGTTTTGHGHLAGRRHQRVI